MGVEQEKTEPKKRAWYVVHTYSGYENKVKTDLESKIHSAGMEDRVFQIVVPMEEETEEKDGKRKVTKRKIFPSYVLIDMIVDPQTWYIVRNTTGVTGFVGSDSKDPPPLSDEEAARILGGMMTSSKGEIEVGDLVRIKNEPYAGIEAEVTRVDFENRRVHVAAKLIGGKDTPVELDLDQVEKR